MTAIRHLKRNSSIRMYRLLERVSGAINNERGDFYISDAVKVILAVVLGALLLAALTLLFNNVILPRIESEIVSLFG